MIIKLSPATSNAKLEIIKQGDVLSINGKTLDFGRLPDGATLPSEAIGCDWIQGPVDRIAGQVVLTVTMPHSAIAGAHSRFPADIVNPPDGRVSLPTDLDPEPEEHLND